MVEELLICLRRVFLLPPKGSGCAADVQCQARPLQSCLGFGRSEINRWVGLGRTQDL